MTRPEELRIPPSLLWMETTQRPRWLSDRHPLRQRMRLDQTRKYKKLILAVMESVCEFARQSYRICSRLSVQIGVAVYTFHWTNDDTDCGTGGTISHPVSETCIWQCFLRKLTALPVLPLLRLGLHVQIGLFTQCHLLCALGAA